MSHADDSLKHFFSSLERRIEEQYQEDGGVFDEPPPLSDRLREKFRKVAARTGMIGDYRCAIVETDWHTFLVLGLPPGCTRLVGEVPEFMGGTSVVKHGARAITYALEEVEAAAMNGEESQPVYLIRGMEWPQQADVFFRLARWACDCAPASGLVGDRSVPGNPRAGDESRSG